MNENLHRHLDGDLAREGLGEPSRREAEAWERLLDAFRVEEEPRQAPPWLETRVMAEIEGLPEPGFLRRLGGWALNPQPVRVSPLMVGLVAAALATLLLVDRGNVGSVPGDPLPGERLMTPAALEEAQEEPVVFVQFVLEAPGASSVAVAGDFDGWSGSHLLSDSDGDGVWTGRVPVSPGLHSYMFLIDDSTWMTDPKAERYAEDGFGNRNAILAVTRPSA